MAEASVRHQLDDALDDALGDQLDDRLGDQALDHQLVDQLHDPLGDQLHDPLGGAPDGILAGRAGDGDIAAFEVLVRRHGPIMRAYAQRILGSNADADDVVQDAFITAWDRLTAITDASSVKAWLMRITSNKAIDRLRARRVELPIEEWDAAAPRSQSPETRVESASQTTALAAVLAALPEGQRRCWVLKELGDHSYDEIAVELRLTRSTVRGTLARARRAVAAGMEDWR